MDLCCNLLVAVVVVVLVFHVFILIILEWPTQGLSGLSTTSALIRQHFLAWSCEMTSLGSQQSFNRDILFCSSGSLGTMFPLSTCLPGDVLLTGSLAGKWVFMCFHLRLHSLARTFQKQFGVSSWSRIFLTTLFILYVVNNYKHFCIM